MTATPVASAPAPATLARPFLAFDRLAWRVGLPFVLLVLLTTGALAAYIGEQIDAEERAHAAPPVP